MVLARNFAIVALIALAVTVVPGGGNVTDGILVALSLAFLAAIGLLGARIWRETSLTRDAMTERQRAIFYGALGALALMVAGLDELFDSGGGTVAWFAIVGASVYLLINTWREASSY